MERFDAIILGAGAAGMFCAAEAGRRGRRVLVIDHAAAPGEKIRISGGGRCNFTNLETSADRFLGKNPRFAISALKRFTAADFVARMDRAGIAWHEKTLGQLFCDGSARQVVEMLTRDMAGAGVEMWLGTSVSGVEQAPGGFTVATARGAVSAARLVVATGGKSIPKMGATGFGLDLARAFRVEVAEVRPALVPLTFAEQELAWMAPLAGVALPVRVSCGKAGFDEALLFTHRGLSGPAVLQISSYWREGQAVLVDMAPGVDLAAGLRAAKAAQGRAALRTVLGRWLPEKLARQVEAASGLTQPLAEVPGAALDGLARHLKAREMKPVGSEGWRTAEVMLGGVATDGLDGRTMEAKAVPGLHFIGEVVDITGWLGGYNFQWAWSSGWVAGQAI